VDFYENPNASSQGSSVGRLMFKGQNHMYKYCLVLQHGDLAVVIACKILLLKSHWISCKGESLAQGCATHACLLDTTAPSYDRIMSIQTRTDSTV